MKFALCLFLIAFGGTFAAFAQNAPLAGFWTGAVEKGDKRWRVDFNIRKTGETYTAFADFIDANGFEREFSVARGAGDLFRLERAQPGGASIVFEGKPEGDRFRGTWSGFGQTATFDFKRAQAPAKFYREQEVAFKNGDVNLAGTLMLPVKGGKFPAVVITHGGTPNARAGYRSWAMHFVRRGIAALIYDKRGAGASTGETRAASMEDLARDAVAGVDLLKTLPAIDARKIGVVGHSQGGWIAPLASTMSKDVAFVIASAASGISPDRQSIYHRANVMREAGFSEADVKIASDLRQRLYRTGRMLLENDPQAAAERRKISAELEKYKDAPWLDAAALPPNLDSDNPTRGGLQLLFFEPVPMWQRVKVPVLLLWGDKDTVVPVEEGRSIIENALRGSGNQNFTTQIFSGVDHAVIVVNPDKTWDFPRVDLNYYAAMVAWTQNRIK